MSDRVSCEGSKRMAGSPDAADVAWAEQELAALAHTEDAAASPHWPITVFARHVGDVLHVQLTEFDGAERVRVAPVRPSAPHCPQCGRDDITTDKPCPTHGCLTFPWDAYRQATGGDS